MRIVPTSQDECKALLQRVSVGRLACSKDGRPYVVPVWFAYDGEHIFVFSTAGQKIEWMRENPKVCFQADEIGNRSNWTSVVVNGTYLELVLPRYTAEREHAMEVLSQYAEWWKVALAERRETTADLKIETVFFRINVEAMNGLQALP